VPSQRKHWKWILVGAVLCALLALGITAYRMRGAVAPFAPASLAGEEARHDALRLAPGFSLNMFAEDIEGARSLVAGPNGTVFVGSRHAGKVYAIVDADQDGRAEETHVIAAGLNSPNGVALLDGSLFVAEVGRILRLDGVDDQPERPRELKVVRDNLPTEEHHGWRYLAAGPDGLLYLSIGAPCNVCVREDDSRFATILRMRPDGSNVQVVARGVRNSVGFDWQPGTDELYFTDNGRDWMGDDAPPDELNRATEAVAHFGFPFCHGSDIQDPEFDAMTCEETQAPALELTAHGASLGMRFYDAGMFPARYYGGIFIAQHGSWNRSTPVGYRVIFVPMEGGILGTPEVFVEGWLTDTVAWGRPVDLAVLPDGSLLISDDKANAIYRITHGG